MAESELRYFDYLADCGPALESALGLEGLSKQINHWRCIGMEFPGDALTGCRRVMETALRTLAHPLPNPRISILDLIDYCEDEGIIDRSMALKCHDIRRRGNKGAHESVLAIDAKMVIELLDDFLRWNAERLGLIPVNVAVNKRPVDSVFIVRADDEVKAMTRQARLAAALSDDKGIESRAQKVKRRVADYDDSRGSDLEKMAELIRQAEEIGAAAKVRHDANAQKAQERLLEQCDRNLETLKADKKVIDNDLSAVDAEILEVLSEHDFVQKLLQGDKHATEKQLDVMAFPRGSNAVTNILQIAGGAGTGKTLCLLAKIISEIKDKEQMSLFGQSRKKALFICFNKGLANYVRGILARYPEDVSGVEVAHYDEYINQLVRNCPKYGYEHLARYAKDARYRPAARIIYGSDDAYKAMLKQAQETVAAKHPDRAGEYYLDSTKEDEFGWLEDELAWIEARFMSDEDIEARYPNAERIGRGTKHHPNERIRRMILEIRAELNRRLEAKDRYTIEQAAKRLFASSDLPKYDAIAIDEVQDFSLSSIRLLLRFRRNDNSRVFLSGDENQKIYQRDFTWKGLGEGVRGLTINLTENMRNSAAIRRFSDRLLGIDCSHALASRWVHVVNADDDRTIDLLRRLANPALGETTALISGKRIWPQRLASAGISAAQGVSGDICEPGLYIIGDLMGKGLEFDNVVVDYSRDVSEDEEAEKRLRYVHFTRARKRLYIRYQGEPPKLLAQYYADFLE